jgi:hypothetical protein
MSIYAELPDGRRLEFPDGTDSAVIQRTVKKVLGVGSSDTPAQPQRTIPQELLRQGGLAARYATQGLAALPGIFLDPFQKLAGGTTFTDAVRNTLNRTGLPQAETTAEKISQAGSEAIAGAAPFVKGATMASKAVQEGVPLVRSMLAKPVTEAVSTGAGGVAAQTVRESGGPEWAAMLAGAVAPAAVSGAQAVGATAKAGRELARPFSKAGQEQVAADVVGRLTQDKVKALANLRQYNQIKELEQRYGKPIIGVPGSSPTAGAVAADYGLLGGQQVLERSPAGVVFQDVKGANNAARLTELAKLRATAEQVAEYTARRDKITGPLREQAFSKATQPVDYGRVEGLITALKQSPSGGKQETKRALDILGGWIKDRKNEGRYSPEDAYALHQDINDLIRGRINDEKGAVRLSAGMATSVKQELADVIEEVAPGFRKYLNTYRRLSRPIERLETVVEKLGGGNLDKVTNALPVIGPNGPQFSLSQTKLRNQLGALEKETKLAPYQRDVLGRVMGDLNSAELAARGGRPPGSDTYQNIAGANFMANVLGQEYAKSGVAKLAQRPLNFAFRSSESDINDIILEAFQDPKKMQELLEKARTVRHSPKLLGLLGQGTQRSTEGLLGALLSQ